MKQNLITAMLGRKVKFDDGLANRALAGKTGVVRTAYTTTDKNQKTIVWYQVEVDGHLVNQTLDSSDVFDPKLLPEIK